MNKVHPRPIKKPMVRRVLFWLLIAAAATLVVFIANFLYSATNPLPADDSAYKAVLMRSEIKIVDKGSYYAILSAQPSKTGLIIYPGAFVDPKAYIASYYNLAKTGIDVFIIKSPLNFALLDTNQANKIIQENSSISKWFVAGHSLGGVAACEFSKNNEAVIDGLILLGSYCNGDASSLEIPVLSISGSNDGLSTTAKINDSRQALPEDTEFVVINGSNHTQFGTFAKLQPGDKEPTIGQLDAQSQINSKIIEFINKNSD